MICQDCQKTYQTVKSPLPFAKYGPALAIVIGTVVVLAGIITFVAGWAPGWAASILIVIGALVWSIGMSDVSIKDASVIATLREFKRRNLVGWALFAYTENGEVHEHLTRPMGVAYFQGRIGGIFRKCCVVDWEGNILPWAVKCWNGLFQPVTIRHRVTGETFTSNAPAQLLAKALVPGIEIVTPRHTFADIVGYERVKRLLKERALKQTPVTA